MTKKNVTIRVDEKLKATVEEACEYLGETITSVVHKKFRSVIDEYYKQRAQDTALARQIADGDNYHHMLQASKREAVALHQLGFDSILDVYNSSETVRYSMYYNFIFRLVCKELGIPYEEMPQRIKNADEKNG
jgi:antitoxin component of RelBE/YafQ-DinJ toxin-antitoxin module